MEVLSEKETKDLVEKKILEHESWLVTDDELVSFLENPIKHVTDNNIKHYRNYNTKSLWARRIVAASKLGLTEINNTCDDVCGKLPSDIVEAIEYFESLGFEVFVTEQYKCRTYYIIQISWMNHFYSNLAKS